MITTSINNRVKYPQSEIFTSELPNLIDGVEVLDTLCPVSKKTGLRENPLTLLRKVVSDPAKARMLELALMELPSDNSYQQMSDEDKVNFLMMRLDSGTPSENEHYRNLLMDHISVLSPKQQEVAKESVDNGKISFTESPVVSNENI